MTEAEMKGRYEESDPSILVNCEIGPRDHGRFSLRLVARRLSFDIGVCLERWHQPEGAKLPVFYDRVQEFGERELGSLAWGIWSARQEIHAEGRATNRFDDGEAKKEGRER